MDGVRVLVENVHFRAEKVNYCTSHTLQEILGGMGRRASGAQSILLFQLLDTKQVGAYVCSLCFSPPLSLFEQACDCSRKTEKWESFYFSYSV